MRDGPFWFMVVETVGLLSFAINAMIVAREKDLSPFAIFIVSAAAAFGGGTVRDLLLGPQATPFFWVSYPLYVVLVFVCTMGYALTDWFREIIARRITAIRNVAEVTALASLAGIGTAKSYAILSAQIDPGWIGAIQLVLLSAFLGSATSAAGSVIRDVLLNELPATLKKGAGILEPLLIGSGLIAVLLMAGVAKPLALLAGFALTVALRAVLLWKGSAPQPSGVQK